MPAASQPAPRVAWRVAIGLAVAFGTWARFVPRSPLWLDEALTVHLSELPLGEVSDALLRDGHPPLYYWLLHGWIDLFGDGDLAVRSLSAVLGVLTYPLVWLLGRRAGGTRVAWASLVLFALSPFAVRYASEARMYALVMLLVCAGALVLDRLLERPSWPWTVALAVVSGALLWTHYWAVYALAVTGAALAASWVRQPARRAGAGRALAGLVGGGLVFLPWVPSLLDQAAETGTPWAIPPRPTQLLQDTLEGLGGGDFAEALLLGTLLAIAGTLVFVARPTGDAPDVDEAPRTAPLHVRHLVAFTAGTLALGWVGSQVTGGAYAARYAAVVAPLAVVAVAVGLLRTPDPVRALLGLGIVGLSTVAVVHNLSELRTQNGELADEIERLAAPTDVVVVCPDQLGPSLSRALDQRDVPLEVLVYPDDGDPRTVDWRDYEERNARNDPGAYVASVLERTAGRTVWVVWQGGYRTLLEQCEAVVEGLAAARGGTVVTRNDGDAFESANLWRIGG